MSGYVVQVSLVFLLTFLNTQAKKPPGYVAPPKEFDPDPPKYEYGYRIQDDKATQGKDEQRDGIYAQGRYYVENGKNSNQSVKYFADDWGYHPVVEYSSSGPHSKTSTNFVLGTEAIKLKNNEKSIPQDPSDPGKAENLAKDPGPVLPTPNSGEVDDPTNGAPQDPAGLQHDPHLQVLTDPPQPLFYYVQPQQQQFVSELETLIFNTPDPPQAEEQKLQLLDTAELMKPPDQIVVKQPQEEFGAKLEPKHTNVDFKSLIDSTKNLVSGEDVLNINAAASNNDTLDSLLEKLVTPILVDNHVAVATPNLVNNHVPEVNLWQEPIVVADSSNNGDKLVDEKTDENIGFVTSTARGTLATLTDQTSDSDVLVTPKPLEEKIVVQVQKTIPYYLGMYEYPTDLNTVNATSSEEAAIENVELGKTLLYFPEQEAPKAEALQALEFESKLHTDYIYERPRQGPVQYIDRPYPVEKQNVPVERKVLVSHYSEKPQYPTSSQAFLLQIPGLFTQQKYSSLVQNQISQNDLKYAGYPLVYAPQSLQYLPTKQTKARPPNKLRKLNLLVFPRNNYFNLPPITKNPNDLVQNYRHSNAQLNNGYLPPSSQHNLKEPNINSLNIGYLPSNQHNLKEQTINGLLPPKKQHFQDHQASASIATGHAVNRPIEPHKHFHERGGRAFFDDKSVRLEYGFMPPLIPSLEIDEHGQPVEKS